MASGYNALDLFLADLALDSPDEEDEDNEGRITLSTVHSAKGLEWNAVLIIDLVEDRFPSRHALARPEDFEEERRLMYVACTRARQELDLYSPATIYSKAEQGTQHVAQSPFVRELPAGLTEEGGESSPIPLAAVRPRPAPARALVAAVMRALPPLPGSVRPSVWPPPAPCRMPMTASCPRTNGREAPRGGVRLLRLPLPPMTLPEVRCWRPPGPWPRASAPAFVATRSSAGARSSASCPRTKYR